MCSIRILLVDDSCHFLQSAAEFLDKDPNITVAGCATSGREALQQVSELTPDLVLMDLTMPGMDGFEATQRIKSRAGSPHVIILTLCDNPEYRIAAEEIGADGFVAKSDFATELCPTIDRVLGVPSRPLSDS